MGKLTAVVAAMALVCAAAAPAAAFCGFYVSGADAKLYNNATMVVMMRDGTRTVLSMQNNYEGPPSDFAMVVPVPVVLQKDNVKTLPDDIFDRVDALAAPRLVEYWEQDPCEQLMYEEAEMATAGAPPTAMRSRRGGGGDLGVTIEAQFKVGEYDIVILSAKDSTGLDTWLRQNEYKIPAGAEPLLRPYVASGMKFFVAKVDVEKVEMKDGQAMLSPLRFHYDSKEFSLPVRLGLVNSAGTQDLIVHILARGQRYEVANFENVTIPTNINVDDATRDRFGEFYAALFDATLEKNPGSVITEYSWDASTCDPCPTPALNPNELATLGADALPGAKPATTKSGRPGVPVRRIMPFSGGFVLTRLHARYGKDSLGEDLVFKAAPPIAGGREFLNQDQKIEKGSVSSSRNMFQGRYAIRHEWTGAIECENPVRGRWGGPPGGGNKQPRAARDLAFVPRGKVQLARLVEESVPEIGVEPAAASGDDEGEPEPAAPQATAQGSGADDAAKKKKGCGGCAATGDRGAGAGLLFAAVLVFARRRRRG